MEVNKIKKLQADMLPMSVANRRERLLLYSEQKVLFVEKSPVDSVPRPKEYRLHPQASYLIGILQRTLFRPPPSFQQNERQNRDPETI